MQDAAASPDHNNDARQFACGDDNLTKRWSKSLLMLLNHNAVCLVAVCSTTAMYAAEG